MSAVDKDGSPPELCDYTLSEAIDALGFGAFQLLLTLSLGIAMLSDSMEVMALVVLGPALECTWGISKTDVALITTCVFLGVAIGSPLWGYISDKIGRKNTLIVSCTLLLVFGISTVFAPTLKWFLALRFFVGICLSCFPVCYVLLAEYVPSKMRGRATTLMQFVWAFGGIILLLFAWGMMTTPESWKELLLVCVVPIVIFLGAGYWLPESLLYLFKKGHEEKARNLLKSVAFMNGKVNGFEQMRIVNTVSNNEVSSGSEGSLCKVLKEIYVIVQPDKILLTIKLWSMWFLNGIAYYGIILSTTTILRALDECDKNIPVQVEISSAYNVTFNYGTVGGNKEQTPISLENSSNDTLKTCKLLTPDEYHRLILETVAEFPAVLITAYALDVIGRKNTYLVSTGIFVLSITPLCIKPCEMTKSWATFLLFCARGCTVAWNTTDFVYTPENYPTKVRATALGICSCLMRFGVMITPFIGQVLMSNSVTLGTLIYILAGAITFLLSISLPSETTVADLSTIGESVLEGDPISNICTSPGAFMMEQENKENERLLKDEHESSSIRHYGKSSSGNQ